MEKRVPSASLRISDTFIDPGRLDSIICFFPLGSDELNLCYHHDIAAFIVHWTPEVNDNHFNPCVKLLMISRFREDNDFKINANNSESTEIIHIKD